jgi:hypothetical protein
LSSTKEMTRVALKICLIKWKVQTISWKDPWNGISRYQQPARMFQRLQNGTEPPLFKLNVSFRFSVSSSSSPKRLFAILFRSHLANSSLDAFSWLEILLHKLWMEEWDSAREKCFQKFYLDSILFPFLFCILNQT